MVEKLCSPDFGRTDGPGIFRATEARLATDLEHFGWKVLPGIANFLLCLLPENGPGAAEVVGRCRARNLYHRDAAVMGSQLGTHAIRIAVKDGPTNQRMGSTPRDIAR